MFIYERGVIMTTGISGVTGIYEAVLLDVGDPDQQIFVDSFLRKIFTKSVRRLNQKLCSSAVVRPRGIPGYHSLRVANITYDLNGNTISPDTDELADLIILQMEYVIAKGEISALKRLNAAYGGAYATSVGGAAVDDMEVVNADGVKIKVGAGRLNNRVKLFQLDLETIKEELDEAIMAYLGRMVANYSKLIF